MTVEVVTYRDQKSTTPTPRSLSWDELVEDLHQPTVTACAPCPGGTCPSKHGPAWSPVTIVGTRRDENVVSVNLLVLDLDHVRATDLRGILARLAPYQHLVHSTHSHRSPHDIALRAVLALTRPVLRAEWAVFYTAAVRLLDVPHDRQASDPSRIYYLPRVSTEHAARYFRTEGAGVLLDVDEVLASSVAVAPPVVPVVPVEDVVGALKALRRTYKAQKDLVKLGIVEAAIDGRELVPQGQGQDPALHRLMCALAARLPSGTPAACVVPVIYPSIVAMGAGPEGLDHWVQKATRSYDGAMVRRIERDRVTDAANALVFASLKTALARRDSAATPEVAPEETDTDTTWTTRLILAAKPGADGGPALHSCEYNVSMVLRHADGWAGVLRFNDVTKSIDVGPGHLLGPDAVIAQTLPRAIADHLQFAWGLFLGEGSVASCMMLVARENAYDPLAESLGAVPWDGVERIDGFLERAAGAVLVGVEGEDLRAHVRRVSRKWFVSAAARALRPGCKVDTVLILEGAQGARKSSLIDCLGGAYYATTHGTLVEKDGLMLAARSWIIEIADIASLGKSDDATKKGFFTTRVDAFRPPFGRVIEDFPRRCLFVGTANREEGSGYLTDPTGNRRYWPIAVGDDLDLPYVRAHRTQLWAEAAHVAREALASIDADGPERCAPRLRWWFDRDEEAEAAREVQGRVQHSHHVDQVRDWFLARPPDKRPASVRTHEVARDVLGAAADRVDRRMTMELGRALRELGFVRLRARGPAGLEWRYTTPELLLTAAYAPSTRPMLAVVGAS